MIVTCAELRHTPSNQAVASSLAVNLQLQESVEARASDLQRPELKQKTANWAKKGADWDYRSHSNLLRKQSWNVFMSLRVANPTSAWKTVRAKHGGIHQAVVYKYNSWWI